MSTAAGVLRRTDIEGVPAFWTPGRGDGPVAASLWVRAGMVDLPLVRHGWLHLIEHVALHGKGDVRTSVNGAVSLLTTRFDVSGDEQQVVAFFRDLCAWLTDPAFDNLDHETRVLRAEQSGRPIGATARHLLWRYGAAGPGVAGYDEIGLAAANADELRMLARRIFTRGNVAVSINTEPPANLEVALPDGPRLEIPPAVPCDQMMPAGFFDPVDGVAISGAVSRSWGATLLARALGRELHRQFRDTDGIGYSSWNAYEPVDAHTAVVATGIDILPDKRFDLVDRTRSVLEDFAATALTEELVGEEKDAIIREMMNDRDASSWPWVVAMRVLLGDEERDRAASIELLQDVTVDDVRAATEEFRHSLLVGVDATTPKGHWVGWLNPPAQAAQPDAQQTFQLVDHPVHKGELLVGRDWIQIVGADRRGLLVRGADLAGVLAYPDGGRMLIRKDGYQVAVEPALWRHGESLAAVVEQLAPDRLLPQRPRPQSAIPAPSVTPSMRRRYWLRLAVGNRWLLTGVLVTLAVIGTAFAATQRNSSASLLGVVLIVFLLRALPSRNKSGSRDRRRQ